MQLLDAIHVMINQWLALPLKESGLSNKWKEGINGGNMSKDSPFRGQETRFDARSKQDGI
jgi:hypothetical protein